MENSRGIALIQVLIITAILSILAIYITKSARTQVQMASWATDKSAAIIQIHSSQNQIIFELLTNNWLENRESQNPIVSKWNFYNKPFELQPGVQLAIQDQAGLINIHYPNADVIDRRLRLEGIDNEKAQEIVAVLLDWQDHDSVARPRGKENQNIGRNGPMPDIREWLLQDTLNDNQFTHIRDDFSVADVGHLNLLNSSETLLTALTNKSIAQEIVTLRQNGQLTRQKIGKLTGITEDEDIFNTPSNKQQINIVVEYGEASVEKKIAVELFPYTTGTYKPYYIMQSEGG